MLVNNLKGLKEENYIETVKKEKKQRHLHTIAEERLEAYLDEICPQDCTVSEVAGIPGGRHDLIKFSYNKHITVFEFFFSPSQVPQDLRLLEQYKSNVQVAILLDKDVDPNLAKTYFRKKPDPFPHIWLRDLLLADRKEKCLRWLSIYTKLIEEAQLSLFLQMPQPSNPSYLQTLNPSEDLEALVSMFPNIGGMQATGTYEFSGLPIDKATRQIAKKAMYSKANGTPVSVTISKPKPSNTGNMEGDITIQY